MSPEIPIHTRSLLEIETNPDRESWATAIRDHVSSCNACRATHEASLRLRMGIRANMHVTPPLGLLERVRTQMPGEVEGSSTSPSPRSVRPGRWAQRIWIPAALAAGLVLGVGIGAQLRGDHAGRPRIVDNLVIQNVGDYLFDVNHDRYLLDRAGQPIEHPGSSHTEMSQWLSKVTGFEVHLGTAPPRFQLSGGRLWHTVSRVSALAEYDGVDHRVTVYAVPSAGIGLTDFDRLRVAGDMWMDEAWSFRAVAWHDEGLLWSAVSDLPPKELVDWALVYRGRR